MKKYYVFFLGVIFAVLAFFGCQNGETKYIYRYIDRTEDSGYGGQTTITIPSTVPGNKITSLQDAINRVQPGGVIDFTDEMYRTITTIEQTISINKTLTIKNFDNLGGNQLNVSADGVVLSNLANTSVNTSASLKISGSILNNLNICSVNVPNNADLGRGEIKERPPRVELLSSDVSSDITIGIENAYLTVHDITADKIKFNAKGTQLTIEDNSSKINRFDTNTECQVVLEDGTSDTIPCTKSKMTLGESAKLTQVNMKSTEEFILTKISAEGFITNIWEDETTDILADIEVMGTYMASGAVTVFTAELTYDIQSTFSKYEKDFYVTIGDKPKAYTSTDRIGVYADDFDLSNLPHGKYSAFVGKDYSNKAQSYKDYEFEITVMERKIEHRLININLDVSNMKTDYLSGEALDLTGLVVEGTYLDNPSTPVGLLDTQYIAEPANGEEVTTDLLTHEIKKVHISDLSGDLSADIEITVRPSCLFTIDYGYSQNGIPLKVVNRIEKGTVVYEPAASRYGYEFVKWVVDETVDYAGFNKEITDDNITVKALWSKNNPFVGAIVYRDGTTNDQTNDRYIFMSDPIKSSVPLGVVFDDTTTDIVDSTNDIYIGKMVHLKQRVDISWCNSSAQAYETNNIDFNTSDDDGSGNWQEICKKVHDATNDDGLVSDKYPAFKYVEALSSDDDNNPWYLPAKNELEKLINVYNEIYTDGYTDGGLKKLQDSGYNCDNFCLSPPVTDINTCKIDYYWSSSVVDRDDDNDLIIYTVCRPLSGVASSFGPVATVDLNVRAIRKFKYKIGQ